jgi:hypothetical protein
MDFNLVTLSEACQIWRQTSMPQLLYFSHIPTAIIALLLGFFVFFKNKKSLAGKILFLFSIFFFLWCADDLNLWLNPDSRVVIFLWSFVNLIELLIFSGTLYFSYVFLEKKDAPLKYKLIGLFLILPLVLFMPTEMNMTGFDDQLCEATQGPLLYYFYSVEILFLLWTIVYLIKKIISSKGTEKKIAAYLSAGIFLFLPFFSAASLISTMTGEWILLQYGLFTMPVFMGFLVYLIVQYKAFDIKLISAQALVISIIALIGSQFFLIKNLANNVLNAVTMALVAIFGWWLVNSVRKEVEAKEVLEQKVQERTRELGQSKKVAEERAVELEKWYKLTIGRELRMAELKEKIKETEEKNDPKTGF